MELSVSGNGPIVQYREQLQGSRDIPISHSFIPQPYFMLPGSSIVLDKFITKDFSGDTFWPHEPFCCFFERLRKSYTWISFSSNILTFAKRWLLDFQLLLHASPA